MDLSKIEYYAKKNGRSMSSVARSCDKSPAGLKQSIERGALPVKDLEKIVQFLEIPLSEIFNELDSDIHSAEPKENYGNKPKYIEQRLMEVENDISKLKKQLKKKS